MRAREEGGARLVEPDMPVDADPEDQQVDSAGGGNGALEPRAFRLEIFRGAVEKVDVPRRDVHPAEEMLIHERAEAPRVPGRQSDELVEVERVRARKIGTPPDERVVHRRGRSARRQAEHARGMPLEPARR